MTNHNEQIIQVLKTIIDPITRKNLVEIHAVKKCDFVDGDVFIDVELDTKS